MKRLNGTDQAALKRLLLLYLIDHAPNNPPDLSSKKLLHADPLEFKLYQNLSSLSLSFRVSVNQNNVNNKSNNSNNPSFLDNCRIDSGEGEVQDNACLK